MTNSAINNKRFCQEIMLKKICTIQSSKRINLVWKFDLDESSLTRMKSEQPSTALLYWLYDNPDVQVKSIKNIQECDNQELELVSYYVYKHNKCEVYISNEKTSIMNVVAADEDSLFFEMCSKKEELPELKHGQMVIKGLWIVEDKVLRKCFSTDNDPESKTNLLSLLDSQIIHKINLSNVTYEEEDCVELWEKKNYKYIECIDTPVFNLEMETLPKIMSDEPKESWEKLYNGTLQAIKHASQQTQMWSYNPHDRCLTRNPVTLYEDSIMELLYWLYGSIRTVDLICGISQCGPQERTMVFNYGNQFKCHLYLEDPSEEGFIQTSPHIVHFDKLPNIDEVLADTSHSGDVVPDFTGKMEVTDEDLSNFDEDLPELDDTKFLNEIWTPELIQYWKNCEENGKNLTIFGLTTKLRAGYYSEKPETKRLTKPIIDFAEKIIRTTFTYCNPLVHKAMEFIAVGTEKSGYGLRITYKDTFVVELFLKGVAISVDMKTFQFAGLPFPEREEDFLNDLKSIVEKTVPLPPWENLNHIATQKIKFMHQMNLKFDILANEFRKLRHNQHAIENLPKLDDFETNRKVQE